MDLRKFSDGEFSHFVKGFGYKLINAINDNTVATPHGIIASGILNCSESTFTKQQMFARVNTYMNHLVYHGAYLSDTLMIDPDNAFNSVVENFCPEISLSLPMRTKTTSRTPPCSSSSTTRDRCWTTTKIRSSVFFVPAAYTAAAIIEIDRFKFEMQDLVYRYQFLQRLFKDEFSFDEQISIQDQIAEALKGFVSEGILVPDPEYADTFTSHPKG